MPQFIGSSLTHCNFYVELAHVFLSKELISPFCHITFLCKGYYRHFKVHCFSIRFSHFYPSKVRTGLGLSYYIKHLVVLAISAPVVLKHYWSSRKYDPMKPICPQSVSILIEIYFWMHFKSFQETKMDKEEKVVEKCIIIVLFSSSAMAFCWYYLTEYNLFLSTFESVILPSS